MDYPEPGDAREEEDERLVQTRDRVLELWRGSSHVVLIGYSFGIRSTLSYDRVWLDSFVEAFRINNKATVHIVDPDAASLRGELAERIKRTVNVHAWL